jgi:uncharacterized iron-regulated membrane protein
LTSYRYIQKIVGLTRAFRVWHRKTAIAAGFFLAIVALTGLLLAFKKPLGLLPPVYQAGIIQQWQPVDSLIRSAERYAIRENLLQQPVIDRVDIRPGDGIAKITFKKSFWELQLHGQTGEVVSARRRYADLAEKIHDGSIGDFLLDTNRPVFTWIFSGFTGFSLCLLAVSGFFLWINPGFIRKMKKKYHGE